MCLQASTQLLIIANFKQHYRSLVLRHLMGVMELVEDGE